MTEFTRRTLRTWSVLDAVHGPLLAACALWLVPWKTPAVNVGLLAWAALELAAAATLWRGSRLGWRLGLAAGAVGLVAGLVLIGGLMTSWAYLRGIYGELGYGVAMVTLLLASFVFTAAGLFSALQLRALLRREVRADFSAGPAGPRAALGLAVLPLLGSVALLGHTRTDPLPPVPEAGRAEAVRVLRAALTGAPRPATPALAGVPVGSGPLYVTLWARGEPVARVSAEGADLAAAVASAADALAAHPRLTARPFRGGRLRVDRVVATGPVPADALLALSVDPGRDGLRRRDAPEAVLLPDDLVRADRFGVAPILPRMPELRLGLDAAWVRGELPGDGPFERLRVEGWVEDRDGVLPVSRSNTPGPDLGVDSLRAAAASGGDFILRQIRPDGRFHYQYFALDDRHPTKDGEYSLPRHAGTVYSLALLFRLTGEARFKSGAEKAAAWLVERIPERCGAEGRACVTTGRFAHLGSTALTLVGMLEYQRSTGDARYADAARRLAEFLLDQQRPDGEFHHVFDTKLGQTADKPPMMFYSEESALALVMAHAILGDDRYLAAAERALDYLTGPKYSFFLGHFMYGADHWTCIAAEEAWPRLKHRRYLDFCLGYTRFLQRMQYDESWGDWQGHYGFSGVMVPQAPAAAGFTEATISTWLLSRHHGEPAEDVHAQTSQALGALLRDQMRGDNAWLAKKPARALGGFRRSVVQQEVRIDFTQHAASALIRGVDLFRPPG